MRTCPLRQRSRWLPMALMHAMFEIAGFSEHPITTFSNVPTRKIVCS